MHNSPIRANFDQELTERAEQSGALDSKRIKKPRCSDLLSKAEQSFEDLLDHMMRKVERPGQPQHCSTKSPPAV